VLSLALVVAIFYFMVKKIGLAQVWAAITDMTWLELTTLGQYCACLPSRYRPSARTVSYAMPVMG
jgi:hypothetical protein